MRHICVHLCLVTALIGGTLALPNGPPLVTCRSMTPLGHQSPSQDLGYFLSTDTNTFHRGSNVTVTVSGPSAFRGLFLQVREGDEGLMAVGRWARPRNDFKLISCPLLNDNAIGHADRSDKNPGVMFTWTAPDDCVIGSTYLIRATVVQSFSQIQEGIKRRMTCVAVPNPSDTSAPSSEPPLTPPDAPPPPPIPGTSGPDASAGPPPPVPVITTEDPDALQPPPIPTQSTEEPEPPPIPTETTEPETPSEAPQPPPIPTETTEEPEPPPVPTETTEPETPTEAPQPPPIPASTTEEPEPPPIPTETTEPETPSEAPQPPPIPASTTEEPASETPTEAPQPPPIPTTTTEEPTPTTQQPAPMTTTETPSEAPQPPPVVTTTLEPVPVTTTETVRPAATKTPDPSIAEGKQFCLNSQYNSIPKGMYDTNFEDDINHLKGWKNVGTTNWLRKKGSTVSYFTGPRGAFDGRYYIYLEASNPTQQGQRAVLESNDLSGCYCLHFRLNFMVSNRGHKFMVMVGDKVEFDMISSAPNSDWMNKYVQINTREMNKIRLVAERGRDWIGDTGLDNIFMVEGFC